MSTHGGKGEKPEAEPGKEEKELTVDDLLADLPLDDKKKKMVSAILTGVVTNLSQINTRLDNLGKQPAPENPDIYEGLSAEQKYQVMMARASAPAAAAQQGLIQALLSRAGGGGGSDIDQLIGSADRLRALRDAFSPAPTAVQVAMEKAQIASVISQTRLMNKVAGKETDKYLDALAAELVGGETGGEEE
ncbi:hypothetical protein ES705_07853 [subsurface metagenome]